MKRTTKEDNEIRYEFTGSGVHVTATGRVLRKGDRIRVFPSEIEPFKDKFRALEHVPEAGDSEEEEVEPESRLVPIHKGGGRYIVVKEDTNETITDGYLAKKEAYLMCGMEAPGTETDDLEQS